KLVSLVRPQRDHRADRHTGAHLEGRNRLLRLRGHRLLPGDQRQVTHERIEQLVVLRRLAQAHVDHNLLELRHSHRVLESKLFLERLLDLFLVLLFQPCCHSLCSLSSGARSGLSRVPLRKGLSSYFFVGNVCPHFLQMRTRVSPSILCPMRVGPQLGQTSATFEMWMGDSCSAMPPRVR